MFRSRNTAARFAGCGSYFERLKAQQKTTDEARKAADDARCREFGFKLGTVGYGDCRLQLEQIRAMKSVAGSTRAAPQMQTANLNQGMSLLCKPHAIGYILTKTSKRKEDKHEG